MLSVLAKDGYMPIENRQHYYIEMNYNGFSQLSFDVSNNDPMSKYLLNEAVIKNEDNRFLIKDVNRRAQNTTYTCEIDLDEWKENIFFDTANDVRFQTKSLGEVLGVIKPNDWKIINASIRSIKRTSELKDATSYDILKSLEEIYSIVFEIRVLSKEIYIVDPEQFEYDGLYATSELNMKKVTWQGSSKDFCTRLYAYGKVDDNGNAVNVSSVIGKEYIDDNTYTDKIITIVWRDERYTDPQSLYDDARKKLDQLCVPKMSYDISIYDLSQMNKKYDFLQFGLYKRVKTLINDELSILQRVVTYKKYYDKPDKNVITLSNEQQKFTSKVSNALGGGSNQVINGSILEQAQKEATAIINEFATKGYRYETENETYFLDKLPKEAAKFVMRQNLGGIAFSQNGWAGPYLTAWTIDGRFNADFITSGTIRAIRIEAAIFFGGSININNRFMVDENGNLSAESGYFKGDISGSNITGSNITGGTIDVNTVLKIGNRIELKGNSDFYIVMGDRTILRLSGVGDIWTCIDGDNIQLMATNAMRFFAKSIKSDVPIEVGSDKRLKKNIKNIDIKEMFDSIKVKRFDYINGKKNVVGVIAQDLLGKEFSKYVVSEDTNGMYAVDYNAILMACVQKTKHQDKRLKTLEERIEKLGSGGIKNGY